MMTERNMDPNSENAAEGENDTEGHFLRIKANEADQPQPTGGEGAEVEGHVARWGAKPEDQPSEGEPEVEGHVTRWGATEKDPSNAGEPEVEGHVKKMSR